MQFDFNPLFNGRFVFLDEKKEDTTPVDPGSLGGKAGSIGRMEERYYLRAKPGSGGESGQEKPEPDTAKALEDVKKGVEETEEERRKREELASGVADKLTPTKRENLKKRMIVDIYDNNKELADKYFDAVKDAIEKMSKDELYKFIFAHTPPRETYVKSEHEKWNKEFCALLDKYMPDELKAGEDVQKQAYTVGGLQNYLVNDFSPANVFQAGRNKRMTNPFIWVDGKMGAYTISAMAEYWNKKYGPTSKDKAPLTNADIDESLAVIKKNREFYNGALTYLATQLKGAPVEPIPQATGDLEVAVVQPAPKETRKEKMERLKAELRSVLVEKGATKETLFAFDMAYDERFKHEIKTSIDNTAGFDQNEPDSWAIIHLLMVEKNPDYANAFLAVPEEGTPAVAKTPTGTPEAPKETSKNPKDEIRAELIRKKANREALFAFEMSDNKDFKSNIDEGIKITEGLKEAKFDNKNPEEWEAVHDYMTQSDAKYAEAFAAAPEKITPAVVTGKKPAEKGPVKPEPVAKKPDEKKYEITSEEIAKKLKELRSVVFEYDVYRAAKYEKARLDQLEDYKELRDEEDMDPDTFFMDFDRIPGSAPDIAFKKYTELYEKVEDEGRNPTTDPEVVQAFGALGKVLDAYYKKVYNAVVKEKERITKKFYPLMAKYDLPKGVVLNDLELLHYDTEGNSWENSAYTEQRGKVLPETLRSSEGMQEFINAFFTHFPTKTLKNIDDLKKYLKDPVEENISLIKIRVVDDDVQLISRLNEVIWFRNMYQVNKEITKLQGEFREAVNLETKNVDSTVIAQYFPSEKKNSVVASNK